ncbi:helix-turn-helix domain-containing protein [Streptomyces neyagawaensis]|uniref:helix-turn-helix domain-containing protein n=1 Tax=Streptomyces neyagawaensis TaxID=42238 RepID=UPI0006E2D7FB|nr:helix-turn-helix domain-containing protein [Streptomyces neyagawaensis]MCL6733773.1 helix-turn-helix domain containing protein [Streptomyces neyagawaensis]MDE1684002.1 helix-turn-helix domain-containing protein [Streptomyces neyagawaensis]
MYDTSTRRRALALVAQGRSLNSVSRETGVSRAAIRSWQERVEPLPRMTTPDPGPPADDPAYSYLLGLYLGDGCLSAHPRGGHYLRIACADAWPGLVRLCREAIAQVRPGVGVYAQQKQGCVMVTSYYPHWPALFPQHGPGKKHERRIVLEPWQQAIVEAHPWEFVRGLIHSDGCRVTNWTTRLVGGERKRYEYPRYFFTNKSDDIRRLYTDTLDRLGLEWTHCTRHGAPYNISVARKASVALMDAHVGAKH